MRFRTVKSVESLPEHAGLTVGYWQFSEANNKGALTIYNVELPDWRFNLAVKGHEFLEVGYCWLFNITTEECDKFDDMIEEEYEREIKPVTEEGGFDERCPYKWGHRLGFLWEYFIIHITFASWSGYDRACNLVMQIDG
jgi:hypothetical protein